MLRFLAALHLLAAGVFVGAAVLVGILVESVGRRVEDPVIRRARYADIFRVYNPLAIASLGVVVMSGAWALTPYKEALGPEFFERMGRPLAAKLVLAFALINAAAYVSFGLCHRLVRADQGKLPITEASLRSWRRRFRVGLWGTIVLAAATVWSALGIAVPASLP